MRLSTQICLWMGGLFLLAAPGFSEEILPNGIALPAVWPPDRGAPSRAPMELPYLEHPPAVIPIDVGRQLFIDDFLIDRTTLTRHLYAATYYAENPVLRPDKPWEEEGVSGGHPSPTAMVFSDGVWYDPQDKLFKMWYMGGYTKYTCYATSTDGIHWEKPVLDVVPGTNIVHNVVRDSGTVWLDLQEKNAARRYKMFLFERVGPHGVLSVYFSGDGIHWGERVAQSGPLGDRSTVLFNPFRDVWVYGIRDYEPSSIGRFRRYWEHKDVLEAARWEKGQPKFWVGADTLDMPRSDLKTPCELYNLDAAAYESVMIGLFSIWRGQPQDRAKPNELCIGFSRDGFHWQRPTHDPFIPVSEHYGDWNWANIQSAGGCCLVVGDQLYFYVSGRGGVPGSTSSGVSATGLATLRRDGFASMDAGENTGELVTRPVQFSGKYLFVNVRAVQGELRAAVLDQNGAPIPPFTLENCEAVSGDSTAARLEWKGAPDVSSLAGKTVRFQFALRNSELYSFWVSASETGASGGYVAAGGPKFTGPKDQ
ncbi:MAG TPA: glycosyl hydrolase family 32 [Candidatus Hydrogenedentes bacterium]|nr:glycosyl hydrolase family 32 [Candidatus Hydrogenedentota bacterium]